MTRLRDRRWLAELLGLPLGTVGSMVSRRQVPHLRIGARTVRFDEDQIMSWLAARARPARAQAQDDLADARIELRRRAEDRRAGGER